MSFIEPTKREEKMIHCLANNLAIDMEHIKQGLPDVYSEQLKVLMGF